MSNIKDRLQSKAVEWSNGKKSILLEWATGVSKTLAALKIVVNENYERTLILCDELDNINTWKDEMSKWDIDLNTNIICYHSLHKVKDEYDCIILDECDVITPKRLEYLQKLNPNKFIYLSATIPYEKRLLLYKLNKPVTWKIDINKAIEKKLLPVPKIYLTPVYLDNLKLDHTYIKGSLKGKPISATYKDFYKHLKTPKARIEIKCTEQQYYNLICNDIDFYKEKFFENYEDWVKIKWLGLGSKRKSFLADVKFKRLPKLLKLFKNKRYIVFLHKIAHCDELDKSVAIHSDSEEKDLIKRFNSGEIDRLIAVRKLNRGKNLKDVDGGIIAVMDGSNNVGFLQQNGRMMRNKEPVIFLMYVEGTKDSENLDVALDGLDKKFLKNYKIK